MSIKEMKFVTNYEDPDNTEEIIKKLSELTLETDIRSYMDSIFPEWIKHATDHYSEDYKYLEDNWKTVCGHAKHDPQQIVLVDYIDFRPNFTVLRSFCEVMTNRGYVVRRKEEFVGCKKCGKAIPSPEVWKIICQKGLPVPSKWSNICSTC